MKFSINMLSSAHKVKGQGVSSAYDEQVALVKELNTKFNIYENRFLLPTITHFHTVDFGHFLKIPFVSLKGATVGYVHFLPETVDNSLNLWKPARIVFYKYLIAFYKNMDYLVTVNPYFIDRLEHYGVERSKIFYIPNYVSEKLFFPVEKSVSLKSRSKYGMKENCFTVCCAGQLQTRKGVFEFIELAKQMPDIQFVWAGGFSFGNITEGYKEIKRMVQDPPENLYFIGMLEREQMNEFYNMADILFLPSYDELFPMTVLEAMCCKLPVLLRDIDIYENILFDFYLKGRSTEEFKSIIYKLKNNPEFYRKYCEKSWKGHEYYSSNHILQMWDDFYSMVAGNAKSESDKKKIKSGIREKVLKNKAEKITIKNKTRKKKNLLKKQNKK